MYWRSVFIIITAGEDKHVYVISEYRAFKIINATPDYDSCEVLISLCEIIDRSLRECLRSASPKKSTAETQNRYFVIGFHLLRP